MGQYQEGIKLLKEALENHHALRNKALNACHLAVAYSRTHHHVEAANYLKLACQFYPQCQLIERTEKELAQQKSPTVG
jgi:hypothetical protein